MNCVFTITECPLFMYKFHNHKANTKRLDNLETAQIAHPPKPTCSAYADQKSKKSKAQHLL